MQTFYRRKKQYVGLESGQVWEMKQLQDENSRLKQLVAELSLNKTMLQDVLRKSGEAVGASVVLFGMPRLYCRRMIARRRSSGRH